MQKISLRRLKKSLTPVAECARTKPPQRRTKMGVPETEGSNEDKIAELYNEAMIDLDLANVSQGEKEILATYLVDIRWEDQQ